jgi:prepilin-type N-terminal cleavage/methylation domain-containing protein
MGGTAMRRGFTLIELLVVLVILGAVTAAIGTCISGGIRVWETVRRFNKAEMDAIIGLQMVEKDLMNAAPFFAVPFEGETDTVVFPGTAPAGEGTGPGITRLAFNRREGTLTRTHAPFPKPERAWEETAEKLISNVERVRFVYYGNSGDGGGSWQDSWGDPTNLPVAVRVAVSVRNNGTTVPLEKTIVFPLGGRQ